MTAPRIYVEYIKNSVKYKSFQKDNKDYLFDFELTQNSFKGKIIPKKSITLVRVEAIFPYSFKDTSKFYGNGYQAWTTSREYKKTDCMKDLIPLAKGQLKELAGISSDWRFVKTPKHSGEFFSHTYTYIKNENEFEFFGSLTERQGFTVFYADMNKDLLTVSKDVEGVTTDKEYELFDIFMYKGSYDEVFDRYFEKMNLKKPRIDHLSGYTSWYNYFQKIDENIILRDLNALDPLKKQVNIFQIDDGYETFVGDWLDKNTEKFPNGMKYVADKIHEKGYLAGIWLAPFNLQRASRTYKEHPDWVIKGKNGRPLLGCAGWGGAYTMDIYNNECREYIKHFFDVVLNSWGYDMVKLDFLYSQCMYPRNNKSRGTIMCEAMEFLRECCGDKLILGCGVHHGASFGYVDACRISCDVDLKYTGKIYNTFMVNNEIPSAKNAINNAVFRRHLNGRAFVSDPDVFFLRYSNLKFTREQKLLLAGINHIFGDVLFVSDDANEYKHDDMNDAKILFEKSERKIISCDENDGVFTIITEIDGKAETIIFDINTGKSNISEILNLK